MATRWRFLITALQASVILLALPIGYRKRSLPELLERLERTRSLCELPPEQVARIVRRIANLSLFRKRWFPRVCLRRALTGFALLSGRRWRPTFVIGVRTTPDGINAHSWLNLEGCPLAERRSVDDFRIVYTYPGEVSPRLGSPEQDTQLLEALNGLETS